MKKIFFLIMGMILSIAVATNEAAADETESDSPKGLSDSDIEVMFQAGLLRYERPSDERPSEFFQARFSVAYNLFYIYNKDHLAYEGGSLVYNKEKQIFSHGIALQYHTGASFMRKYDWRGNPLLGANLLLDFSFGSGGAGSIMTLGIGGEAHFLWVCKIAAGTTYVQSGNKLFSSDKQDFTTSPGRTANLPIRDKKSRVRPFFQGGVSVPVSHELDVFALGSLIHLVKKEELDFVSVRLGVSQKF